MVKRSSITIINDTDLPVCCYVYINDVYTGIFQSKKTYHFYSIDDEIKLYQLNYWEDKSIINRLFLLVYSLDFVFGMGTSAENLPIKIDQTIKMSEINKSQINISNYIQITKTDIDLWRKYSFFQSFFLCLIIILIVVLFSFLLPNPIIQIIMISIFLLSDILLFVSFYKKIKNINSTLHKYIN